MKRKLLVAFSILFVVILTYYSGVFKEKSQRDDVYAKLKSVPNFDRKSVEGHYFILHFWAKWCPPCVEEIPEVVSFAKKAETELGGLKLLAVSLDENLESAKTALPNKGENLPSNFTLLLDVKHNIAESFGSYQYPETYLYDPKGNVVEKWIGAQKWNSPEVMEYFKKKVLPKP